LQRKDGRDERGGTLRAATQLDEDFPELERGDSAFAECADARA